MLLYKNSINIEITVNAKVIEMNKLYFVKSTNLEEREILN